MPVTHAMGIAQSGMDVAAKRLAVSANNVANMETDEYKANEVVTKDHAGGGVSGDVMPIEAESPVILRDNHLVDASNTDIVRETIERVRAVTAYRANAQVARAAIEVSDAIIDAV
jgi:flagellar basal body rod protein FlgC